MANNESNQNEPTQKKPDPRLRSFLRKAAAIIAAEKGLNASSRVKLESLAEHDKLPDDLLEEALKQLQSDDVSNLTHYEKAFSKFLEKEFSKIKGGVVSLGMEQRAIKRAETKYQINSTRAEQLIEAQSQAVGVSRISPDEAAVFAEQIIVDRVADQLTIDQETRDQLYKIGGKWAYSKQQVDQIIFREVSNNRSKRNSSRLKIVGISIMALLAISAGVAYAKGLLTPDNSSNLVSPAEKKTNQPTAKTNQPKSTLDQLQSLAESDPSLNQMLKKIKGNGKTGRLLGYQQLARTICLTDRFDQTDIPQLIQKLYLDEQSDQAATEILGAFETCLEPKQLHQGVSVASLKSAYRANRFLAQICFGQKNVSENSARISNAKKLIPRQIRIPISPNQTVEDYLSRSETAIATDQWSRLIQSSWNSPAKTATLYDPVLEITSGKLDPEILTGFSDHALISIIKADSAQWRSIRQPIAKVLKDCDEARLAQWISAYLASDDDGFRAFVGPFIVARTNVDPRTTAPKDVFNAIAKYDMAIRNEKLLPLVSRNENLDLFVGELLQQSQSINEVTPGRIAQVALAANKLLAFCTAIENVPNVDETSFAQFDRLAELEKPVLRNLITLPVDRAAESNTSSLPTSSDIARKKSTFDRLSNLSSDNGGLRRLAIDQLARVSVRFDRLTYKEAQILAKYLLSNIGTEELLNAQQKIEAFSKWPNLSLAIADQLPNSSVQRDQAITIARLLIGAELESPDGNGWKEKLQSEIFQSVESEIAKQVALDPRNSKSDWNRLEVYLHNLYRDRLLISRHGRTASESFVHPSQATLALVSHLSQSGDTNNGTVDEAAQANTIVMKSDPNEIARIVLANQFLMKLVAAGINGKEESNQANKSLKEFEQRSTEGAQVGEQLYASEFMLFRLLDLKRKSLVRQLLTGDQ